jgi:hypothetical protein
MGDLNGIRKLPPARVKPDRTQLQLPEGCRRWIRMRAWRSHFLNPSTDVTVPVATRGWGRCNETLRRWTTVNKVVLVATPAGVVTDTNPAEALPGTVALSWFDEVIVNAAAAAPKRTAVTPAKFDPSTVTSLPTAPETGENEVIDGGRMTLKAFGLVAVPAGVTTLMRPLTAPDGTTADIWLFVFGVNAAWTPFAKTT